jgi:hypothetical protein
MKSQDCKLKLNFDILQAYPYKELLQYHIKIVKLINQTLRIILNNSISVRTFKSVHHIDTLQRYFFRKIKIVNALKVLGFMLYFITNFQIKI